MAWYDSFKKGFSKVKKKYKSNSLTGSVLRLGTGGIAGSLIAGKNPIEDAANVGTLGGYGQQKKALASSEEQIAKAEERFEQMQEQRDIQQRTSTERQSLVARRRRRRSQRSSSLASGAGFGGSSEGFTGQVGGQRRTIG